MIRELFARFERRLALGRLGLDPDTAGTPAAEADHIRDRVIEVKTTGGWRVWARPQKGDEDKARKR